MIFVFYFFAVVLILLSYRSFRGGAAYLRFFQTELAKPRPKFSPFVSVIVPCRGLDDGLEENLFTFVEQDYPEYEVIFVVDDKDDPAVEAIEVIRVRTGSGSDWVPVTCRLLIAGKAENAGQKVENLREAVLHASERSEAFVFVDSDARPSPHWLSYLVAPLEDEAVGAATGYRWFIADNPSFASELRSAWNASIASALGPNITSNFCWGGSTAISRNVFERLNIRDKWIGTLSDDFTVTRALSEAKLPIVFVPQALTASVADCSWSDLIEFTNRQMKITRVYAPKLWLLSLFGSSLFNFVILVALLIVVLNRENSIAFFPAIATILLVTLFSLGKSWLRLKAVRLALPPYESQVQKQFWPQMTLWIITPALFLYNSLAALVSRRINWRGTRYELKSPSETVIIAP